MLKKGDEYIAYDGVYHPLGAIFQARLLDNQKGANTERYVFFGKLSLSRRDGSNADLFLAPALFQP